jgi:hypothetical protein
VVPAREIGEWVVPATETGEWAVLELAAVYH